MVDLYSKWLDVVIVLFSQHSEYSYISHLLNPEVIMSDNGAPSQGAVSAEFKEFLSKNGILYAIYTIL